MSDNVHSLTRRSKTYFKGQEKRDNLPSFSPLSSLTSFHFLCSVCVHMYAHMYVHVYSCMCVHVHINVCEHVPVFMCVWRLDTDFLFCFHLNF